MVRLKKKRFVVLDYTIQPNETDMATANSLPYMEIPGGAGKVQCITKECTKVGVPVKLYDNNPEDTVSLYLRSGLCFECQRNLNEKRRVDRKRKPDGPTMLYSIAGPNQKKFKYPGSDEVIELKEDAIIVNGSMKGVKLATDGHSHQDIAVDLQDQLSLSTFEAERLLSSGATADPMTTDVQSMYEKAFTAMNKAIFLMTQWKAAWENNVGGSGDQAVDPNNSQQLVSLLLAADKDHQQSDNPPHDGPDVPQDGPPDDNPDDQVGIKKEEHHEVVAEPDGVMDTGFMEV